MHYPCLQQLASAKTAEMFMHSGATILERNHTLGSSYNTFRTRDDCTTRPSVSESEGERVLSLGKYQLVSHKFHMTREPSMVLIVLAEISTVCQAD